MQTTRWPEKTEVFLKELAHTHALYANPTSKEDHRKLCAIFDEFYLQTDFRTWKPPKHDERLWQLFRVKLDKIQTEMLLRGETMKMRDGTVERVPVTLPPANVATIANTSEALATPPATPVLGTDKYIHGVELWNGLDVDAQAALFRHQLRNAKNRKGLMLEWNEYCAEIKEKREQAKSRDPQSATHSVRSPASKTPPMSIVPTPAPAVAGVMNVREIIANRVKVLEMKRAAELLQAAEERAGKRVKADPA